MISNLLSQKDMLEKVTGVAITDSRTESLSQGENIVIALLHLSHIAVICFVDFMGIGKKFT